MASELQPWKFELEIFPTKSVTCGHVFEPKLNAQQGAICEAFFFFFFWKCFEQSTSWCFGSHFFLIDALPFATVVFWLHLKTKTKCKEKHGKKTPLSTGTATNCSTLARHALKLICQTLSIQFCSSRYWAMRVRCLVVTSRRSRDRNAGFSAADDADARSVVFVFIQINTFTYLRKMSIYQTNSVYVKLYLYSTK